MQLLRNKVVPLCLVACAFTAHAKNLGVQGSVFEIIEPDLRAVIMQRIEAMDADKIEKELLDSAKNYEKTKIDSFKFPVPDETFTKYIDPTIEATKDIIAPVPQEDGSIENTVIVSKGTRANPLVGSRPVTAMLYIDGDDEEQVEFLAKALEYDPVSIIPVLLSGSANELSKTWKRSVFRAFKFQLDRLRLENSPSLVYAGEGEHFHHVAITAFTRPFDLSELKSVWVPTIQRTAMSEKDRDED